jgi:hypothetical protein
MVIHNNIYGIGSTKLEAKEALKQSLIDADFSEKQRAKILKKCHDIIDHKNGLYKAIPTAPNFRFTDGL